MLYEKHFKRNYLHVEDAARCFTWAIEHWDAMVGRCYNAGLDDANLSKQELAEVIGEFVPNLKIHEAAIGEDPDKRNYIVSNERLYGTGYRPAWSLRAGIRQLLTAYELLWHPAAMMGPWRNA